jgi:hypothetical protein
MASFSTVYSPLLPNLRNDGPGHLPVAALAVAPEGLLNRSQLATTNLYPLTSGAPVTLSYCR